MREASGVKMMEVVNKSSILAEVMVTMDGIERSGEIVGSGIRISDRLVGGGRMVTEGSIGVEEGVIEVRGGREEGDGVRTILGANTLTECVSSDVGRGLSLSPGRLVIVSTGEVRIGGMEEEGGSELVRDGEGEGATEGERVMVGGGKISVSVENTSKELEVSEMEGVGKIGSVVVSTALLLSTLVGVAGGVVCRDVVG